MIRKQPHSILLYLRAMRTLIFVFTFLLLSFHAYAQVVNFDRYTPIVSKGALPDEFIKSFRLQASEQYQRAQLDNKRSRKDAKDFFISSNYGIVELLQSGRILFNDPLGEYMNTVFRKVTEDEPEAAGVKIFLFQTPSVNAFATNDGLIFVTTGMLARLQTEAELAFLLCHEYIHYKHRHVLTGYLEEKKMERNTNLFSRQSSIDVQYQKCQYSKSLESEADMEGLALFMKSPYSRAAPEKLMHVLKYADIPTDSIGYHKDYFATEYLKVPVQFYLETPDTLNEDELENEKDTLSTHPNVRKRRNMLLDKLGGDITSGEAFIVATETEFREYVNMARFELCRVYYLAGKYRLGFYHCNVLMAEFPGNAYLKEMRLRHLYRQANNKISGGFTSSFGSKMVYTPDYERYLYAIKKFNKKELAALFLLEAWQHYKNDTTLGNAIKLRDEAFRLAVKSGLFFDFFEAASVDSIRHWDSLNTVQYNTVDTTAKKNISRSRINRGSNKKKYPMMSGSRWIVFAFTPYLDDPEFKREFKRAEKKYDKNYVEGDDEEDDGSAQHESALSTSKTNSLEKSKKSGGRYARYATRKKIPLGRLKKYNNPKIILLEPTYYKIDQRKQAVLRYEATDDARVKLLKNLELVSRQLKIDQEIVVKSSLESEDMDKFNEIITLEDVILEIAGAETEPTAPLDGEKVESILTKYNASYVVLTGVVHLKDRTKAKLIWNLVSSIVMPFTIPATAWAFAEMGEYTFIYAGVFDLEESRFVWANALELTKPDDKEVIESQLYYLMMQMKKALYFAQDEK